MALFPPLPVVKPLASSEDKRAQLDQTSSFKKSLLAARKSSEPLNYEQQYVADMDARHSAFDQAVEDQRQREDGAWVSDAGLDSTLGQVGNKVAGFLTGLAREGGQLASLPFTGAADAQFDQVSDEMRAAYAQEQQYLNQKKELESAELNLPIDVKLGKLGPIEAAAKRLEIRNQLKALQAPDAALLAKLDEKTTDVTTGSTFSDNLMGADGRQMGATPRSARERIESGKKALGLAKTINDGISGLTDGIQNTLDKDNLDSDLSKSWDANKAQFDDAEKAWDEGDKSGAALSAAKGVAGLVMDGGVDIVANPSAAVDYIAENIPQLAVGLFGKAGKVLLTSSNVAYGGRVYREALEDYQAKNDGKLPTQDEAREMLAWSVSAAAAEHVMDSSILKSFKGAAGDSVKSALGRVAKVADATATGAVGEAITEGFQTAVEENLSKLDYDIDGEKVFKGAAIGAAAGGGLKGGLELANAAAEASLPDLPSLENLLKDPTEVAKAREAALSSAKETGEVAPLLDASQPTYDPGTAVVALQEYASKEGVDADQVFAQTEELVAQKTDLQARKKALLEANTEEGRARIQASVETLDQQIAATEDPQLKSDLESQKTELTRQVLDEPTLAAIEKSYTAEQDNLASMEVALNGWKQQRNEAEISSSVVEVADTPVANLSETEVADVQQAVSKTLTLAMRGVANLPPEKMEALANNTENALVPEQRDYLLKAAAARRAVTAAKDLEQVSREVLEGGNGNLGLANYQKNYVEAQRRNDPTAAKAAVAGLQNFAEVHRAKLDAFSQAFEQSLEDGQTYRFLPEGNGQWVPADRSLTGREFLVRGGIAISAQKSGKLLNALEAEVTALETSAASMQAALALPADAVRAPATPAKPVPVATPKVAPAQTASAPSPEPQAKGEVSTEPASTGDFEADVAQTEADIQAKAQAEQQAAEQAEQQRRTTAFLAEKVPKPAAQKSDYVGSEEGKVASLDLPATLKLVQAGDRETTVAPRPLVAVKDFASRLRDQSVSVDDFLATPMTESQAPLVGRFLAVYDDWAAGLKSVLRRPRTKQGEVQTGQFFRDPIQFFLNDDLEMEENVQTALLAAAFAWISEEVNSPLYRTDDEIKAMLGLDPEAALDRTTAAKLREMLGRRTVLEFRLGQFAVQALGLKNQDEHTPKNELPRLQGNLGAHLFDMLNQLDLIHIHEVDLDLDSSASEDPEGQRTEFSKDYFISLNRDNNKQLSEPLEEIRSVSRGTGGIMADLFGMEAGIQLPLLAAPKVVQETTNSGKQKVAASVKAAMQKFAKREYQFRPTMQLLQSASQGFLEDIAGIQNVDRLVMHKELRASAQAANDNLRRELEQVQNLWAHLGEKGDHFTSFYALPDQWKNSRIGYRNTWANMQASKIARFLVAPKGWETEVSMADLDSFKLRVLEGLDQKTDSTPDVMTLTTFDDVVSQPHIAAAVQALRTAQAAGQMTPEAEATVANAVQKIGTKLHAFESLVALAQYEEAKANQEESFTTMLTTEIDGKTNGPMLSLWLLGVMNEGFAQMGGFYTKASGVVSFGNWKPGNHDLYQFIASKLLGNLQAMNLPGDVLPAVHRLVGNPMKDGAVTSAGRNLVKNPLTTLIYGSGMGTTVGKMTDVFVEKVYETVAAIVEGKSYGPKLTGEAAWAQFQQDLMILSGETSALFPDTAEAALETGLNKQQLKALRQGYMDSIGEAVTKTIETEMAPYMAARKQMVRQANLTWNLYDQARTKLLNQLREHLMDTGSMPFKQSKGKRVPLRDLTPAEEKQALAVLKDMEPRFNTALSQRDGDLEAGIYVAKEKRATTRDEAYVSNVQGVYTDANGSRNTTHQSISIVRTESNPGVSVMANGVQSVDGNIIVEVIANLNAVGVHDALLVNLKEAMEAGQQLNQQTMDMLLNYSLPRQSLESLARTLTGYMQYINQNPSDFDPQVLRELLASQREDKEDVVSFKILVERAARFAYRADRARLNGLAQIGVVDQYTIEAGVFNVPDSFRNQARKLRDALNPQVDPALLALAEQLDGMLKGEVPVNRAKKQAAKPVQLTLDETLRSKENLTAGEVIAFLRNQIGQPVSGDVMGGLYQQILAQGAKVLKDLPVKYYSGEQVNEIPEEAGNAYGWYHVDAEGSAHIGIRGSDLPGSAVSSELVVHEVLHALVSSLIQQAEQGKASPEVAAAVAELTEIQAAVAQHLAGDTAKLEQFQEALGNVQEFVTWGMTNPAFQAELKAMPFTSAKTPSLKNRAQQFFQAIARVVFGKQAPAMTNALSHLFARVSVLIGEVQPNQQAQAEGTWAMAAPAGQLQLNPTALFEGLAGQPNGYTDPAMAGKVQELMESVVEAVGGPFQQFYQQAAQGAKSAVDVVFNAQQQGLMPVTAGLRTSGFALGDQQAYAIEVLTLALQETQRDTTHEAEKQLLALYRETAKTVTPADLGGQAQWDALFGAGAVDANGQYLARFAAMALAYPPLASKMGFTTQATAAKSSSLYGKVLDLFEQVLNFLAKAAHKAYAGQQADEKLNTLVKRLVALEGKYQLRQERLAQETWIDTLEDQLDNVGEKARAQLAKFGRNPFFTQSGNAGLRLLGNLTTAVAEDRVGAIVDAAERLYHRSVDGQMGFLASMINEMRGTKGSNMWSRVMTTVSKAREKQRQDINRDIAKAVREGFANKGKNLTREQKGALTNVLLRSGAVTLLDQGYSLQQIEQLLRSPVALEQAIQTATGKLNGRYRHYYEKQANYLGYMLATSQDKGANTLLNVENIARLENTFYQNIITEAEVQAALPVLDELSTLRALAYLDADNKQLVANLMRQEGQRQDKGNGVLAALLLHKSLLAKAKERVFQGSERLMRKGYVPEIHNPHLEVTAVPVAEQARYEAEGYKFEANLPKDPADVTWEPRVLMSIEKVTPRYLSGSLSLTSMKAQGTSVHSGLEMFDFSGRNDYNYAVNRKIEARRGLEIQQMFKAGPVEDLSKVEAFRLTPVTNADGKVVNYRYMMSHANRDRLLERTNDVDLVLGELASNTFDKETTVDHNDRVIKGLKEQWELEKASIPQAYILVGPDSKDKTIQEQYRLLPKETRRTIEAIWGGPNMMMRRDTFDLHFGYRKYSLAESMMKDSKDRSQWENFFAWLMQDFFKMGPKAVQRILKAENLVMAVNQEIKDFFVVKSGVTTYWNIVSNLSLLKLYGVSVAEIVRSHRVALKGARDWQKNASELRRLKAMRDSGYIVGSLADLDQQIAILEDQQARSPVREVMAMGMMPTLVEDMDNADDPYSYKNYAAKKGEKVLQYVPNFVKQGAKWVYMTHDTPIYQFLSQGAQLSDFVARYTLYEHLKTRRNNPMSQPEAAMASIDAFINYDHLSHRYLQYLNDVGLVRFTKYYMRIQMVLMHLYQQNPARALLLGMIENYFSGMQTVMDSAWWGRIGLPFEVGPLDYPEAVSEGLVSKYLLKLF